MEQTPIVVVAVGGAPGSGKSTVAAYLELHGFARHGISRPPAEALREAGATEAQVAEGPVPAEIRLAAWEKTRPEGPVVVDDYLVFEEGLPLRARGAKLLRLYRPGLSVEQPRLLAHATITNNGTVQDLEIIVHKCLRELGVRL